MYIGVDIGGTKISIALVSKQGKILKHQYVPTPSSTSKQPVLDTLHTAIDEFFSSKVKGIGVGVPGVVQKGVIHHLPNIKGFKGFDIKNYLKKAYKVPVKVENDVSCFLLGEQKYGVGHNAKNIIAFTIGTGFGSAVMINGALLSGASEVGRAAFSDGLHEDHISGSALAKKTKLSAKEVFKSNKASSITAQKVLYDRLTDIIATSCSLIALDCLILGGSVGKHLNLTRLKSLIKQKIQPPVSVVVVKQKLSHPSSLGAASLVME